MSSEGNAGSKACEERRGDPSIKARTVAAFLGAAAVLGLSTPTMGGDLSGFKGDRLRGSISCVHPEIVHDLIARIGETEDYTPVLRIYLQQGYCIEADVPTVLDKPIAGRTFQTWDGHQAEIWETTLTFSHGGGTTETLRVYSIVFPREMTQAYND